MTISDPSLTSAEPAPGAFVSYSRIDRERVMTLVRFSQELGQSFWVDADRIPPAAPWRVELGTALEMAPATVCCLSTDWMASEECQRELERSLELGKRLIPVVIRDVDPTHVQPELAALQWIDARDGKDQATAAAAVVAAIQTDHDGVREHTQWLMRALRWQASSEERSQLLRGRELRAAEDWLAQPGAEPSPTPLQTRFVSLSRRYETRRERVILAAVSGAAVLSLVLAALALVQRQTAVEQRDQAESRELAAVAMAQLGVDPERSLLLSRLAWRTAQTDQALGALRAAVDNSTVRMTMNAHEAQVSDIVWSQDGRLLLSAGRDGTVAAWDAKDGTARGAIRPGDGAVERLSADRSGRHGVMVTARGSALLWSVEDGELTAGAPLAETSVRDAAMSADGTTAYLGLADGTVQRWALEPSANRELQSAHSGPITSLAVSDDQSVVVSGTRDGTVHAGGPGEEQSTIAQYRWPVASVALTSDGELTLTAADNGDGSVRRTSNGALVTELTNVYVAALDSSGRRVASSDISGRVFLYDLADGQRRTLAGPGEPLQQLQFSADGTMLVAAGLDGVARVWRVGDARVAELRADAGAMSRTAVSPDGRRVVTGYRTGQLRVWQLPAPPALLRTRLPFLGRSPVEDVDYAPNGLTVATASGLGLARVWRARDASEVPVGNGCTSPLKERSCLPIKTVLAHVGDSSGAPSLTQAEFSPDGSFLATSAVTGSVVIWDSDTADEVSRLPDIPGRVDDVAFSPDGTRLLTSALDGRVRVAEVATGRVLQTLQHPSRVNAVAFLEDGRMVTGDADGRVVAWDPDGEVEHRLATLDTGILGVAVDGRSERIALATGDRVELLNSTGEPAGSMGGHTGLVTDVAFQRSGQLVVSGGMDGTVRVWDVTNEAQTAVFDAPRGLVNAVAVSPSRPELLAGTSADAAYIFTCDSCRDVASLVALSEKRVTRALSPQEMARFVDRS